MSISDKKFLAICDEFPRFHAFLSQRALMRRNHFRLIEMKIREQEKVTRIRRKIMITEEAMNKETSKTKMKQIANARDKTKLLNRGLLELSHLERPRYKGDIDQLTIKFTAPIIRVIYLYLISS